MGVMETTHPDHHWFQMFSSPGEFGFNGVSRHRTWCIGWHKKHIVCLVDPFEIQNLIVAKFRDYVETKITDYMVASETEIQLQGQAAAKTNGVCLNETTTDWTSALSTSERKIVRELSEKYAERFLQSPETDPLLVYFLGDTAGYCSWSAVSKKIPCYRLNSKTSKYFLPCHKRWLTPKERLVSMAWPCTVEQATELDVPLLACSDLMRASSVLGNSMRFTTVGIFQLICLSCFGPRQDCLSTTEMVDEQ